MSRCAHKNDVALVDNISLPGSFIKQGGIIFYLRGNISQITKRKIIRIVQVAQLIKGSVILFWHSSGFVIPEESVKIYVRLSGNIMSINPKVLSGRELPKGEWLAALETTDFELALKFEQAQFKQAKANLSLVQLVKEELIIVQ